MVRGEGKMGSSDHHPIFAGGGGGRMLRFP